MKHFEMPETHICDCSDKLTYDKNSKVCIECVKAQATVERLIEIVLSAGNPELSAELLFILLSKRVDKKKEDK